MAMIKLTSWNIENLRSAFGASATRRLDAICAQIREIDPDILCIQEGSPDVLQMRALAERLGGWRLVELPGTDDALGLTGAAVGRRLRALYATQGTQWIWFLVKDALAAQASLLEPRTFDVLAASRLERTELENARIEDGLWTVYFYRPREGGGFLRVRGDHGHYRHPQTLVLTDLGGRRVEIGGCHMKSKINLLAPRFDPATGAFAEDFLAEALTARLKLASEAVHVRAYVDARHFQEERPAVFVCGDLNDGPGKEYFERVFMVQDLLSNIQGDVFFASKFLNHALFDFADKLRWSYDLPRQDAFDPNRPRQLLLDHILFTQALVDRAPGPQVRAKAGLVEHPIHDRTNARLPASQRTSDHIPVSVAI
jgi:endonuclease/exonuclease/phosphatase family metal-dependent hydrolase